MSVPPRYVASWLAVAGVATAVGVGTVAVVRSTVGADTVVTSLSQAEVRAQLSQATGMPATTPGAQAPATPTKRPASPSSSASAHPSHTPQAGPSTHAPDGSRSPTSRPAAPGPTTGGAHSPSPSGAATVTGVLASPGGTVVAQCTGGSIYLLSWSPAQGYAVHEVHRGGSGAREAEITFEGSGAEVQVHVTCGRDGPVAQVESSGGGYGADDH